MLPKRFRATNTRAFNRYKCSSNELIAGVRADVAGNIYGDDLDTLVAPTEQVEGVLSRLLSATSWLATA